MVCNSAGLGLNINTLDGTDGGGTNLAPAVTINTAAVSSALASAAVTQESDDEQDGWSDTSSTAPPREVPKTRSFYKKKATVATAPFKNGSLDSPDMSRNPKKRDSNRS